MTEERGAPMRVWTSLPGEPMADRGIIHVKGMPSLLRIEGQLYRYCTYKVDPKVAGPTLIVIYEPCEEPQDIEAFR